MLTLVGFNFSSAMQQRQRRQPTPRQRKLTYALNTLENVPVADFEIDHDGRKIMILLRNRTPHNITQLQNLVRNARNARRQRPLLLSVQVNYRRNNNLDFIYLTFSDGSTQKITNITRALRARLLPRVQAILVGPQYAAVRNMIGNW